MSVNHILQPNGGKRASFPELAFIFLCLFFVWKFEVSFVESSSDERCSPMESVENNARSSPTSIDIFD